VALFSKSGFSNELLGLKDERLRLYEIKDYEELL
jgi:ATPase